MARLREWMDPSEAGDTATPVAKGWVVNGNGGFGSASVDQTHVYHDGEGNGGQYAMLVHAGTFAGDQWMAWTTPPLTTPVSTFRNRFHYYRDIAPNFESVLCFWSQGASATNSLGCVTIMPDGHLKLYSGGYPTNLGAGTLLATSTNTLAPNTWYIIEVGVHIANAGTYELRVNNTSVGWIPSASGDTQPGSITTVDRFWYVSENNAGSGGRGDNSWFDDMVGDDANWIGESVLTPFVPRGYGHTTQLTPHGNLNNWQTVDERPPSDADYNEALALNKKDTYIHTPIPGAASTVHAVMVMARITAIGGAVGHAYLVTRSGGADYESASIPVPFSPGVVSELRENDPATAAPWTVSAVNASEIGIRFDA